MKRTFLARAAALLLLICLTLPTLFACSPYRLELSNEKESEVVLKLGEYDVNFEVVNFFYHNYKMTVDGGDPTVWEGEDAARYHEQLMSRALEATAELYAVFATAKDLGLDPYGVAIEEQMEQGIREVIDSYPTRRDYIEDLEEQHMTDSVYRLLMRSYFCQQHLLAYADRISNLTEAGLRAFCEEENIVNTLILAVYFDESTLSWAQERSETIMDALANCITDDQFRNVAQRYASTYVKNEMKYGTYMTLREFRRLAGDSTLTPSLGEIYGPYFDVDSFLIIRTVEKDYSVISEHPDMVRACYLEFLIEEKTEALYTAYTLTEAGQGLSQESFA